MRPLSVSLLAFAAVQATTPISDPAMSSLLASDPVALAAAAQPMFFFGQALNRPPCYPTHAVSPSSSAQTPPGGLCAWPNAGCGCRTPGIGIGNPGPSFPVYYSLRRCRDDEVRVVYNLFYEKDGFTPEGVLGHPYDWERVVVVWRRGPDGQWRQSDLLLSQHSGYDRKGWNDIQNTFSSQDATQPRGGDNGRRELDHPKVYVAWAKHAHYHDRNTGWNDALSQLTNNAFRSQDWWYYPTAGDYVLADDSTQVGRTLAGMNWGSASSHPVRVHEGLCQA